jgi:ribose 5-phosphate isomerase B
MANRNVGRRGFLTGMAGAPLAAQTRKTTPSKMKLAVGSDHAGFPLKEPVVETLKSWGYSVKDCGTFSTAPVDFPDIAKSVCDEILSGRAERGIMVCGTGVGAAIAANKIRNIRAALCSETYCAHQCVEHDNVNVLCIGAWVVGQEAAKEIIQTFLNAKFTSSDADFQRRIRKLEELEKR